MNVWLLLKIDLEFVFLQYSNGIIKFINIVTLKLLQVVFCVVLDILRVLLGSLWNAFVDQPSLSCLGSFALVLETDGFFTYRVQAPWLV